MKPFLITAFISLLVFCSCNKLADQVLNQYNQNGFHPANFSNSTVIDNIYFPVSNANTLVYEGETEDGLEHIEEKLTNKKLSILGVQCVEVNFKAWLDGELVEEAWDWYAQDNFGTVWYFGEAVDNYEDGMLVDHEGSWKAGVDGAKPGIIMLAAPKNGLKYREEFYEGEAEDEAQVVGTGLTLDIPFGRFENCIKTRNWTRLEPGIIEYKYYAPGIGLIKEENPRDKEEIFLVKIK